MGLGYGLDDRETQAVASIGTRALSTEALERTGKLVDVFVAKDQPTVLHNQPHYWPVKGGL
jgi:hypothetical protein